MDNLQVNHFYGVGNKVSRKPIPVDVNWNSHFLWLAGAELFSAIWYYVCRLKKHDTGYKMG